MEKRQMEEEVMQQWGWPLLKGCATRVDIVAAAVDVMVRTIVLLVKWGLKISKENLILPADSLQCS